MLREWATATFQSATDYWTFRKVITLQVNKTHQQILILLRTLLTNYLS